MMSPRKVEGSAYCFAGSNIAGQARSDWGVKTQSSYSCAAYPAAAGPGTLPADGLNANALGLAIKIVHLMTAKCLSRTQ